MQIGHCVNAGSIPLSLKRLFFVVPENYRKTKTILLLIEFVFDTCTTTVIEFESARYYNLAVDVMLVTHAR